MRFKKTEYQTWLRTIAEVIAIIGGTAAIIKLFIADKDMSDQIKELKVLAKQSIEQTIEFRKQNEILKTQNDLAFEQIKIQEKRWEKDILPFFTLTATPFELGASSFSTKLINTGRMAKIVDVVCYNDNTYKFNIPRTLVGTNSGIELTIQQNEISKVKMHFSLYFEDLDGNKYHQSFVTNEVNGESVLTTSRPEKIK